jgi:hypothetical protein
MVVGILQVELVIDGSQSLKDKRRVVKSLKDRLHREHMVSVAEVDQQDSHSRAVLGIAVAGSDPRTTRSVLDRIVEKMRLERGYYISDQSIEVLTGQ